MNFLWFTFTSVRSSRTPRASLHRSRQLPPRQDAQPPVPRRHTVEGADNHRERPCQRSLPQVTQVHPFVLGTAQQRPKPHYHRLLLSWAPIDCPSASALASMRAQRWRVHPTATCNSLTSSPRLFSMWMMESSHDVVTACMMTCMLSRRRCITSRGNQRHRAGVLTRSGAWLWDRSWVSSWVWPWVWLGCD